MPHRITSSTAYGTRPKRQRGMVTIVVMLFLIATVVFALSQMLDVSSGNVVDGQRQGDSTAAFFIAESGLEKAHASVNAALGGTFTNASCSGVASNYNLGRGSVSVTAVSTPPTCNSNCEKCSLTSTGQVGFSTHTLTKDLALTETNGVFCNGANGCSNNPVTWQLKLKNTAAVAGIGVFNLTYIRQGNNQPTCAAGSNCRLQLDLSSPSNGANSVGLMGNSVLVPAGATYPIYQTMTKSQNNLAEVGAFFLGTTAPQLTGPTTSAGAASYWDHKNSHAQSAKTVGSGETTGGTNDGTATSGGTCDAPGADFQSCTSWCYGGDTLVFAYAGSVTLLTDQLSSVTFGTNAGTGQNVAMTRVAKYPTPAITGAPANVDAEIWYARNPNFTGASPLALNASSYKGRGTGAVGARWTSSGSDATAISGTTLTVGNSFAGYPNQIISVGDTVSWSGGTGSPTCAANTTCGTVSAQVTPLLAGEQTGGRGRYTISTSQTVNSANNRVWTISSTVLHVTACTICFFDNGDALSGLIAGRTINNSQASLSNSYSPLIEAIGGIGRYPISGTATYVASGSNLYAGTPGTTLYLPSSSSQPLAPDPSATPPVPQTLITVKSGTGVLAPGTRVTAVGAPNAATSSFTVTAAPTTALDGASLCAGTCALFVPGTNTTFALGGITANFNEWAGGFTCLKGVDQDPNFVTSTSPLSRRWTEVIH